MPWTFEQQIQKASSALIDRSLLDETQVEIIKRPLFFNHYAYGIGMSLELTHWGDWIHIKDRINDSLKGIDMILQSNRRTYQFNAFSSDVKMLRWFIKNERMFSFNHLRIVDRSCWHLRLPKPRPKGKFYGEYGWRFGFKDPMWGQIPDNVAELEKLQGPVKMTLYPRTFVYLSKLSDVLLFKLIVGEQLLSLEDRHTL